MLLKKLSKNASYREKITIGLIGINRGVGVTYTGMLLASYFGVEKGIKTAYLECNNHNDFTLLEEAYEWSSENDKSFSLDRITYYKQVTINCIPEILANDYDCYILDFGTDFTGYMDEFMRCSSKIIIGDYAIWNWSRVVLFAKAMEGIKGSHNWIYLIPDAKARFVKLMAKEIKRYCFSIPNEPDPTVLSKETHRLFHSLFG